MTDSEINEDDTSDTNENMDTEEDDKNGIVEDSLDDKTDDDTDIEAAVFEFYHRGSGPHSTISTIKGTHKMLRHGGLPQNSLGVAATGSSSATTDNDMSAVSPTTDNDGVPINYILDNNFSSVFSHRTKV